MTANQIARKLEQLEKQMVPPDGPIIPDITIWFVEAKDGRPTGRVLRPRYSGGRLVGQEEIMVPVEELLGKPRGENH
jgi:hypothetical protein